MASCLLDTKSSHPSGEAQKSYEETAYEGYTDPDEPRARLPVRPGGLCRLQLDGTLPFGQQFRASPRGGAQKSNYLYKNIGR